MLSDPLKQVVDRLDGIPGEKQRRLPAWGPEEGNWWTWAAAFGFCKDAGNSHFWKVSIHIIVVTLYGVDKGAAEHRAKLLSSLNQILKIFQAQKYSWRQHVKDEIGKGYGTQIPASLA